MSLRSLEGSIWIKNWVFGSNFSMVYQTLLLFVHISPQISICSRYYKSTNNLQIFGIKSLSKILCQNTFIPSRCVLLGNLQMGKNYGLFATHCFTNSVSKPVRWMEIHQASLSCKKQTIDLLRALYTVVGVGTVLCRSLIFCFFGCHNQQKSVR